MSDKGGMQLLPGYRQSLDPAFLAWYLSVFRNDRMAYAHWSGGCRNQDEVAYHILIEDRGGKAVSIPHCPIAQNLYSHTFGRNTNSFAVCVASMAGGTTEDLGPNAPTPAQLKLLIQTLTACCLSLKVPVANLMSHAEAADNLDGYDGYAPYGPAHGAERWDLWCWIDPETLALRSGFQACPTGWLAFMDWLRGEVILEIERLTADRWKVT